MFVEECSLNTDIAVIGFLTSKVWVAKSRDYSPEVSAIYLVEIAIHIVGLITAVALVACSSYVGTQRQTVYVFVV